MPSSSRPALKSIQCGFRCAISELDEILMVGTGKPSGVPRPVVKRRIVAPLAIIAVLDTPSLPGDSSSVNPAPGACSPYRMTDAPAARPPIRHPSPAGIRRDAAEPIVAAALVPDDQLRGAARHATISLHSPRQPRDQFRAAGAFVADVLRVEETHAAPVDVSGARQQRFHLIGLATKAQHQHAARIGIAEQTGESRLRVPEIIAQLAAAIWMAKGLDAIDALPQTFRCALRDALRHEVDTADRIENPDLVARAGPAVVAAVAVEGGKLRRARRESHLLLSVGTIFVAKQPLQPRR